MYGRKRVGRRIKTWETLGIDRTLLRRHAIHNYKTCLLTEYQEIWIPDRTKKKISNCRILSKYQVKPCKKPFYISSAIPPAVATLLKSSHFVCWKYHNKFLEITDYVLFTSFSKISLMTEKTYREVVFSNRPLPNILDTWSTVETFNTVKKILSDPYGKNQLICMKIELTVSLNHHWNTTIRIRKTKSIYYLAIHFEIWCRVWD